MVEVAGGVTYCAEPDCRHPAARGGRCWGHVKQLQRTGRTWPLAERPSTPRERLDRAAHDLGQAVDDTDEAYRLAVRRFWEAYRASVLADVEARRGALGALLERLGVVSTVGRRMGR